MWCPTLTLAAAHGPGGSSNEMAEDITASEMGCHVVRLDSFPVEANVASEMASGGREQDGGVPDGDYMHEIIPGMETERCPA